MALLIDTTWEEPQSKGFTEGANAFSTGINNFASDINGAEDDSGFTSKHANG